MDKTTARSEEAVAAVAAYLQASEAALGSARRLREAWRNHLEADAEAPTEALIAETAEQQMASDLALGRAKNAIAAATSSPEYSQLAGAMAGSGGRTRRRRRRENKLLAPLGRRGQRVLRWALMMLLAASILVAGGACISLVLEFAGLLHLVDDPVQLPVGIQIVLVFAGAGATWGISRALRAVDRTLYGSKGAQAKGFRL